MPDCSGTLARFREGREQGFGSMQIDENQIRQIVEDVMRALQPTASAPTAHGLAPDPEGHGVFRTVEDAIGAADEAQRAFAALGLEKRKEIIAAVRRCGDEHAEMLARLAVDETRMGRYEDKVLKNRFNARYAPGVEDLPSEYGRNESGSVVQVYDPVGVVAAIAPVTNPTSTIINNAILILSAGNAVVFCPHPSARACSQKAMTLLNEAMVAAGAPRNLLTCLAEPDIRSAGAIMKHPRVRLVNATGGPGVVRAALESGKKAIAAGPGNPPVVVDETADLRRGARAILRGASFDNDLPCICEKEIIVVDAVAGDLMRELKAAGAYELTGREIEAVTNLVWRDNALNKAYVGKDASVILRDAGVSVSGDPRLAVFEAPRDHPLAVHEQLMPVLPLLRARDFSEALELAATLEHGFRHTAIIHSRLLGRIQAFTDRMACTLTVVNAPSVEGNGPPGSGYLAMTLAGPTGEGFTRPRNYTRQRRIYTAVDG